VAFSIEFALNGARFRGKKVRIDLRLPHPPLTLSLRSPPFRAPSLNYAEQIDISIFLRFKILLAACTDPFAGLLLQGFLFL